ncbi:MAG: ABC transporter substrate-binding protein [Lachnospiraceae bacterium]|nr:ABC transporter substrate-binding protein [Lachnospiraceae bacterium]
MRMIAKRLICLLLTLVLISTVTACGILDSRLASNQTDYEVSDVDAGPSVAVEGEKIINIGVTDSFTDINPFVIDQTEIVKYAVGLFFLPLVELDENMNFQDMIADSITTEDNIHFIVHIDDNATWSDGKPVTAYDVEYSVLRYASPIVGNTMLSLYVFEGTDDETGFVEAGASSMDGLDVLDEKTIQFTTKQPMGLTTFQNSYGRYLYIMPKHIIEKIDEDELTSDTWFNKPDVISGPYFLTSYVPGNYISYAANADYWKGAPKIDKLNIKIVEGSQIYSELQSGRIDMTEPTMTTIPQEEYESIERLKNVRATYCLPITNQSVFIQTANLPDERVRQALLYGIDRQQLVDRLLKGHGEVTEGFLSSASPYYDASVQPVEYDPQKAQELLEVAGWDSTRVLRFYVNSGDSTFLNGVQSIVEQWAQIGINAEVIPTDLATLMQSVAGTTDYDLMAVQYVYAPIDPYTDVQWLLSGDESWTGYYDEEIAEVLGRTQLLNDAKEIGACYSVIDRKMQQDVPMFSAYVISAMSVVNNRVIGAEPRVYGLFNDIQNWDVAE